MNVDGFKIDKNKKVGRKISALQGVTAYMNIVQKHVLMIFTLQFNYFPLVWMYHSCVHVSCGCVIKYAYK